MNADQRSRSPHPFEEEGYALMGAAFDVHREIGGGLAEEIYQESFEIELRMREIPFCRKPEVRLSYKGIRLKKPYFPDLVAHEQIVTELKAVSALTPEHEAQLLNYMRIMRKPIGYLINFGPTERVEWKRFILSEFLPS